MCVCVCVRVGAHNGTDSTKVSTNVQHLLKTESIKRYRKNGYLFSQDVHVHVYWVELVD